MRNKINKDSFALFATILYGAVMLLTFEWYCSNTVLTDLSFMNIAGLPFYRMEFASIIFAAAMIAGSIVGSKWRLSRRLISLSLSVLAVFAFLMAFLNVDLFQMLSPTMRISHVTMSVSRILTILLGVSGLFVGLNCGSLQKREISRGTAVAASGLAVLLSALAVSGTYYQLIYFIITAALFAAALYFDFAKGDQPDAIQPPQPQKGSSRPALTILCAAAAALLLLITPRFLSVACALPGDSIALITGLLLIAAAALWGGVGASPWAAAGFLLGSILNYVVTHYCSVETIYSGNRVVHAISPAVYLIIFAAAALAAAGKLFLSNRKRSDIK